MPTEKQNKVNEKPAIGSSTPAHEAVGSSEFTSTVGCYPIRLPDHPERASGGFILSKIKDFYDYYWIYYREAPTRIATRFFWSENGWDYIRRFTTTGMWSLDPDASILERLVAGLGFSLKTSIFVYAVAYGNYRTRYQLPRNAAIFRALRPCALLTATCLIYSGSWPLVRAIRGTHEHDISRDVDAALVGAITGVTFTAMWIRNSRFVGISIPVAYLAAGISAGLYNASRAGYATERTLTAGWGDHKHWARGNFFFGPSYDERLALFQSRMKDLKYQEFVKTSIKTQW